MMIVLLTVLLFLWLIHPRFPRRQMPEELLCDYAHRGLWNSKRPENSLSAFRAAAEAGYGIELDVHLTRDGQLIVHHDNSLQRMCGVDRQLAASSLAEIRACRLAGTGEAVPTLDEVLALVDGRVPLLVEVKVEGNNHAALCRALRARMQAYGGPWCMESFDPRACAWFRKNAPDVIRGQLAFNHVGCCRERAHWLRNLLIASMMQNVLSRPDFIAYDGAGERCFNLPMMLLRLMRPAAFAAWTVRSPDEAEVLRRTYQIMIFEGFESPSLHRVNS